MSWLSDFVNKPSFSTLGKLVSNPGYDLAAAAAVAAPFVLPELIGGAGGLFGAGGAATGAGGGVVAGGDLAAATAAPTAAESTLLNLPGDALAYSGAGLPAIPAPDATAAMDAPYTFTAGGAGAPVTASTDLAALSTPYAAPDLGAQQAITNTFGQGAGIGSSSTALATPGGFAPTDAELAGTGAGTPSSGSVWDTLKGWGKTAISPIADTKVSPLTLGMTGLGLGGLGYSLYNTYETNKMLPSLAQETQALQGEASQLSTSGAALMNYLNTGNLPPGLQTSINQATASAKVNLISKYASSGMDANPKTNSTLAQELSAIDQQAVANTAEMEMQLYQTGLSATNYSSGILKTIAGIDQTQTQQLQQSIANFAASLGKGVGTGVASQGLTLKVAA